MRFVSLAAAAVVALAAAPAATAWTWPADGPVLQGYANGADPYAAGQHRGIDIGGTPGDPVRAPAAGRVSYAGTLPHYGRSLTIRTDDGWVVTLLHLGTLGVARGAVVTEGQTVAELGSSGEAEHESPSVHLGIRHADDEHGYVDPVGLLPARAVPADPVPAPEPAPPPAPPAVNVAPPPVQAPAPAPAPAPAAAAAPAPEPGPPPAPAPVAVSEPVASAPAVAPAPAPVAQPLPLGTRTVMAERVHPAPVTLRPADRPASTPAPAAVVVNAVAHATRPAGTPRDAVPVRRPVSTPRPVQTVPERPLELPALAGVGARTAARAAAGGSAEPRPGTSGPPATRGRLPALLVVLLVAALAVAVGAAVRRRLPAARPVYAAGPCPVGRRMVARPACRRAPLASRPGTCRPRPRPRAGARARPRRARVAVMA